MGIQLEPLYGSGRCSCVPDWIPTKSMGTINESSFCETLGIGAQRSAVSRLKFQRRSCLAIDLENLGHRRDDLLGYFVQMTLVVVQGDHAGFQAFLINRMPLGPLSDFFIVLFGLGVDEENIDLMTVEGSI